MNIIDVIETLTAGETHNDLPALIKFLEKEENQERLFEYWDSLDNSSMGSEVDDKVFKAVVDQITSAEVVKEGQGFIR